ncbi:hypothetical protein AVEN_225060-1 [Araneus ventricosus]|uniref:Uncharacterized protein n=1 Tax=Araneus ventricosus TaxID=182803 RepID=A0A4Y2JBT5_ARAVE|nr:hypothetical protein AVEN_225060-1 [Araneus ventricosus]
MSRFEAILALLWDVVPDFEHLRLVSETAPFSKLPRHPSLKIFCASGFNGHQGFVHGCWVEFGGLSWWSRSSDPLTSKSRLCQQATAATTPKR